jgi:hypothetical protein
MRRYRVEVRRGSDQAIGAVRERDTDAYFVVTDELWVKHHVPYAPAFKAAVDYWRRWPD